MGIFITEDNFEGRSITINPPTCGQFYERRFVMGQTPEEQSGQEDLTPADKKLAEDLRKAEEKAGIKHPEIEK